MSEPQTQRLEEGMRFWRVTTNDGDPRISVAPVGGFTWRYAQREAQRLFPELRGRSLETEALEERTSY